MKYNVTWTVCHNVEVEADSKEEAIEKVGVSSYEEDTNLVLVSLQKLEGDQMVQGEKQAYEIN